MPRRLPAGVVHLVVTGCLVAAITLIGFASFIPGTARYQQHLPGQNTANERVPLVNEQLLSWHDADIVDQHKITVSTDDQSLCYSHRAVVIETENTVKIAVFFGRSPGQSSGCLAMILHDGVPVNAYTEKPIGDRRIIAYQETNPDR